jgi:hypothetical protein
LEAPCAAACGTITILAARASSQGACLGFEEVCTDFPMSAILVPFE